MNQFSVSAVSRYDSVLRSAALSCPADDVLSRAMMGGGRSSQLDETSPYLSGEPHP